MNRSLTSAEEQLIRWALEHGSPDALDFLPQLEKAEVTPYRCRCDCASINLSIDGCDAPSGGMHILADFLIGKDGMSGGLFVFEQNGILAGLEVYGLAEDAPKTLPSTESLRPFGNEATSSLDN